jgi:hypothetical protein
MEGSQHRSPPASSGKHLVPVGRHAGSEGASVASKVGAGVGATVTTGVLVGALVGAEVGLAVAAPEGGSVPLASVGLAVEKVGLAVGTTDGAGEAIAAGGSVPLASDVGLGVATRVLGEGVGGMGLGGVGAGAGVGWGKGAGVGKGTLMTGQGTQSMVAQSSRQARQSMPSSNQLHHFPSYGSLTPGMHLLSQKTLLPHRPHSASCSLLARDVQSSSTQHVFVSALLRSCATAPP